MLSNITLNRPLAIIDLETTGTDPRNARIVEICILTFLPDGRMQRFITRVHPGIPIPPEATAVHGITNQDVKGKPRFEELVDEIVALEPIPKPLRPGR